MRYRDHRQFTPRSVAWLLVGLFFFQDFVQAAVPEIEREALVALYESTNGEKWYRDTNWLMGDPCANEWYGISCDDNENVTGISLKINWMWGKIPPELGNLSNLVSMDLRKNYFRGAIPPEFGNLNNLGFLYMAENRLTESIPVELGNLSNLRKLLLQENDLSGSIPVELGNLTNLKTLDMSDNQLSGAIPAELWSLVNLQLLGLGGNEIVGTIPEELGNLTGLQTLQLGPNRLSGSIPATVGNLVELEKFSVVANALTGELPIELLNLSSLSDGNGVDLNWNALYTSSIELDEFLNTKSSRDWSTTQTVAPANVNVTSTSEHSVMLAWDAIEYTQGGGRYRASWSMTPGGPYTDGGVTLDKTETELIIKDLPADTTLYFVVQTETNAGYIQNKLVSDASHEVSGRTQVAPPGIFIAPTRDRITTEPGGFVTFKVVLDTQPIADVTMVLTSSDPSEGIVSVNGMTFTADNWNVPQVVTVIGVDDDEPDGHIPYTVFIGGVSSTDIDYDGIDPPDISVTNLDDEDFQRAALVALYNSTNGEGWGYSRNWLSGDPCEDHWYGVYCDLNAKIIGIDLDHNSLSGTIPTELGLLAYLKELELSGNQLTGLIPTTLGNLTHLTDLDLAYNSLSGSIPATLGKLTRLTKLYLYKNQLNGSIPAALGNLSKLQSLWLHDNQLSGSIPATLGNLTELRNLVFRNNQLSGSIPIEFGNLTSLWSLQLGNNRLSGSIPFQFGNMLKLDWVDLSKNQLSGSIPDLFAKLPRLGEVDLGYNQLSGSIPSGFGDLNYLRKLNLSHNLLSGSIPAGFGTSTLFGLSLQYNQLSGPIPADLGNLGWLRLDSNQFSGAIPASFAGYIGRAGTLGLNWNGLFTEDADLDEFLDDKSESDWSSTQTIAPGNISVSDVDTDSVTLAWESIEYTEDAGGYRVWYATSPGGPYLDGGITVSKSSASHTVAGLNPGQDYYFVVTTETNSHSDNKNSVISEESDEIFASTTPANPTGIKATDGTFVTHVEITFNLVADATVYRVFRCLDSGQTCGSPIGYPVTGIFEDRNVVPGTVYYYRVKACIASTCGKFSPANTGFAAVQLPQPTGIRASDGTYVDRVHISWDGVHGAGSYRVFRCLDVGQTCGAPIGFPQGTSFDDGKAAPATVYYYRVKACDAQQCSKFSVADTGNTKAGSITETDEITAFKFPDQNVPIPTLNNPGRWLLILMILGFGLALVNRKYARGSW